MAADAANPTAPTAISPAARKRLQALFDSASKSVQSKNFDYAIDLLSQCVAGDPGTLMYIQKLLEALYLKYNNNRKGATLAAMKTAGGKASIKKSTMTKDWAGVIKSGVEVLKINPWDISALLSMAKACEMLGYSETQLAYLKGGLNADPKSGEVNREAAIALTKIGQYDQAIDCWRRVIQAPKADVDEANREVANLHVQKTMINTNARMEKQATNEGNAAADNASSESAAAQNLSPSQRLEEKIKANPADTPAYIELADLYTKEEKFADAERVLRLALEATGGDIRVREQLEDVQLRRAQQGALIAEKRAAELKTPETVEQAQRMRVELNQREIEVFRSRVDRYPTNTTWKYELGLRLKKSGNFQEAIKLLQESRTDPKRKGVVLIDLGECFHQIKQYKLALQQYGKAIEEMPEKEVESLKKALYRAGSLARGLSKEDPSKLADAEKYLNRLAEMDFGYRDVADLLDKIARERNKE
jgi:tetratricopeptide (TPR) repeat protein